MLRLLRCAVALSLFTTLASCARDTALDWAGRVAASAAASRCTFDDHCVSAREVERYRLHRRDAPEP
jgi:hypothetical protein